MAKVPSKAGLADNLPSDLIHVTAAVRYNHSTETINGNSIDPDPGDYGNGFLEATPVTGDHTFTRVNPSIGVTFTPTQYTTYYADYNEASRAPTVIELGCANPQVPCGLPDDFASDPDLTRALEATSSLYPADLNGDGRTDLLHVSRYGTSPTARGTVLVRILNPGPGSTA